MGRKTFDSLGKPLDGRDNWVLTRDAAWVPPPGVRVFHQLQEALSAHGDRGELMVIGGAELYRQTLPIADRLEVTEVHAAVAGETCFPPFDRKQWREAAREDRSNDERHEFAYSFVTLIRAA
jgi:dihydrofolate reductase